MELIMKPQLENNLTAANLAISQTFCVSYLTIGLLESTVVPNIDLVSVSFIVLAAEEENAFNTLPCAPSPEDAPKIGFSCIISCSHHHPSNPFWHAGRDELCKMRAGSFTWSKHSAKFE
ncbi:hypothetical protein TURU_132526 [Turdus rufiventris]|nr:hypothetical protein TURU_132526 [Turdus rufiventris]